jgi:uncharacterized membrane protein
MEGIGAFFGIIIVVVAVILLILLIFLPLYVFQISGSAKQTEWVMRDILYEFKKTNEHLLPPPQE